MGGRKGGKEGVIADYNRSWHGVCNHEGGAELVYLVLGVRSYM